MSELEKYAEDQDQKDQQILEKYKLNSMFEYHVIRLLKQIELNTRK
jgi:hypothetical protein